MKNYARTLLRGDPHEKGIIRQTFKDMMAGVLPR
jgi:hypothetical protein